MMLRPAPTPGNQCSLDARSRLYLKRNLASLLCCNVSPAIRSARYMRETMQKLLVPITLASCLLGFMAMPLLSQDNVDGFLGRVYKKGRQSMPYRLFVPKGYDKSVPYPLVIWLHGGGSAGDDNIGQISLDNKLGTHFWTRKENQDRHPAFVLAPQSTGGWDSNASTSLSDELRLVLDILDAVRKDYTIDAT